MAKFVNVSLSEDVEGILVKTIDDRFREKANKDHYNKKLMLTFILQSDAKTYKRGRLANVKAGNVFYFQDNDTLESTEKYRALTDAVYNKKDDSISIFVTTLDDYYTEVEYQDNETYIPTNSMLCRGSSRGNKFVPVA